MPIAPVGAETRRPFLKGDEWGTVSIGRVVKPVARDLQVLSDNDYEPLGSDRGYASFDDALEAARRLTAGPDDGTAAVFKAQDRYFLQNTFTESTDMVGDDWIPFELQAKDLARFRVHSPEVLALVNGTVGGKPSE